ncbi:MAG: excalibur calcium-binding domain-containing protein [Psychrobacter sp.]
MINKILVILICLIFLLIGYRVLQPKNTINQPATNSAVDIVTQPALTSTDTGNIDNIDGITPTYVDLGSTSELAIAPVLSTQSASSFSCDGRTHCSQMTSCAEATYFTNYCPNTKMDGNHDGVPCEQQWCN